MIDNIQYVISKAPEATGFGISVLALDGTIVFHKIWKKVITPEMKRDMDEDAREYIVNECLQDTEKYLHPCVHAIVDCLFSSLDTYDIDRMYKEMYSLIMAVRKHKGLSVPEGY